jgi:hypothetical protein
MIRFPTEKDEVLMHRFCLTLMLIILLASTPLTPVIAQDEVKLSSMEVDLWPEYDRPTVLVIYRVTLPATASLPADLSFRIPVTAGEPSAVAVRQTTAEGESGLFTIPYERQVVGEWGVISLTATLPELQLEYYDPSLVKDGELRQFEYSWPGDYAVDVFKVQVQQPMGASEMSISPSSGQGVTGSDGLVYYNKEVGSLLAGQTFSLMIDYKKSNDDLTAANLQVQPSAPVTITPERNNLLALLPWTLGVLGVVLIVGGVVWYLRSGRGKEEEPSRRRHRSATLKEPEKAEGYIYCHQCGKRAGPGDRFCRMCGAKLSVE